MYDYKYLIPKIRHYNNKLIDKNTLNWLMGCPIATVDYIGRDEATNNLCFSVEIELESNEIYVYLDDRQDRRYTMDELFLLNRILKRKFNCIARYITDLRDSQGNQLKIALLYGNNDYLEVYNNQNYLVKIAICEDDHRLYKCYYSIPSNKNLDNIDYSNPKYIRRTNKELILSDAEKKENKDFWF